MTSTADHIANFNQRMASLVRARQQYDSHPSLENRARRTGAEQSAFDALRPLESEIDRDAYLDLLVLVPSVTGSCNPNSIRVRPPRA